MNPHNGKRGAKLRAQVARCRCVRAAGQPAVVSPGRARERRKETDSGVTRWAIERGSEKRQRARENRLNRSGG